MVKKILTYIIVFLTILLVTASTMLIVFSTTLLNKNYILSTLEKEDYYNKTYSSIIEKCKDNTIQSGLEDSVLDGIITKEELENDIKSFVEYIYTGKEYTINKDLVKTRLEENINKVIEENNKRVDKSEQEAIDIYVKTIADIYEDGSIFSKEYSSGLQQGFEKVQNIINKVKVIVYIVTAVLIIFVIIMNRKNSIRSLSTTFIASGIVLIIPKIIETIGLELQNVVILNQVLSKTVINTVEDVLTKFIIFGIVFIVLGIASTIIGVKIEENKK